MIDVVIYLFILEREKGAAEKEEEYYTRIDIS